MSTRRTPPKGLATESSLLSELAEEAAEATGAGHDHTHASEVLARRVHDTLRRIYRFFVPFCEHANRINPQIKRSYRIDSRTAFTSLQWREAFARTRNRDMAEAAMLDHVTFSVRLCAPEPLVVTRRWDQLPALKMELRHLNLHTLDDLDVTGKPKQEWYEIRLAPDIPVLMRFKGNFSEGRIDVLSSNIDGFGVALFEVDLEDVTPKLLDGIGRFLIGRSNALPLPLRRIRHPVGALTIVMPL